MRGAVAGLVAVGLLVAGCAADRSSAPTAGPSPASAVPSVAPVPGIEAEAVRLRTDEVVGGRLQVRVTDTGPDPFLVTGVAVDSPGFAPLPATAVSAAFVPGRTIDLPTPFGDVRCGAAPEPAAARLTVVRPGGAVEELVLPLSGGTLARVHREACAVEALLAGVGIALSPLTVVPSGDRLSGEVVVTRRDGDEPVRVTALARSVLMVAAPTEELPVALQPGAAELRLPVTFEPATCHPHVLAEAKKPFVFPLTVAVGEDDGVPVDLPLDGAQRAALQELVERVCG